jgi:hypothetical protein
VNRCVYLAPALALATADLPDRPVVLVEMGASAGLLLGVDRYRTELTGPPDLVLGDPASAVRCAGADRSEQRLVARSPPPVLPAVAVRRGLDRHPVDLTDAAAVRWLEACLWPDVPGRVERFRSAVDRQAQNPRPSSPVTWSTTSQRWSTTPSPRPRTMHTSSRLAPGH